VQYNPQSIYTGTYIQEVWRSLSGSDTEDGIAGGDGDTEGSQLLSLYQSPTGVNHDAIGTHRLPTSSQQQPYNFHRTIDSMGSVDCLDSDTEDPDASSTSTLGCYIFMDPEEEDGSLSNNRSTNNPNTDSWLTTPARRCVATALNEPTTTRRGAGGITRNLPALYLSNQRLLAHTTTCDDSTTIHAPSQRDAVYHQVGHQHHQLSSHSPMKHVLRTMFGLKKKKKRYLTSPSPLDFNNTTTETTATSSSSSSMVGNYTNTNKHRISDLAVQALAESCSPIHSAGMTRNALVDFSFWEEAIMKQQQGSRMTLAADAAPDHADVQLLLPTNRNHDELSRHSSSCCGGGENLTEDTSHSSTCEDDATTNDDAPALLIKAVSLLVQDFIFGPISSTTTHTTTPAAVSSSSTSSPTTTTTARKHSFRDEFDTMYRPTSEDIARSLDIVEQGQVVLCHIRGRTGVVDDLQHDSRSPHCSQTDHDVASSSSLSMMIPWIHLYDTIWIPHYEEYVIRAVYNFSCQLFSNWRSTTNNEM
jgi:hypothetical protein